MVSNNQKGEGKLKTISILLGIVGTVIVGLVGAQKHIASEIKEHLTSAPHSDTATGGENLSSIPFGAVIAFDLEKCPNNTWKEYKPAYGRFIRGIDRSGTAIDPEQNRAIGSLQEDDFKSHTHTVNGNAGTHANGSDGSNEQVNNAARVSTSATGGSETRPKNIALLYCQKV